MSPSGYTPELIKKIKERVNLVEVVGEHVVLKKSGSNFSGLCPFHSERTPSFSVSEVKQLYHCYGCKAGGDLIRFVMDVHGLGFAQAIEELAQRAGIPLESKRPTHEKRQEPVDPQALYYRLNRFAAAYFRGQLPLVTPARDYFAARGIDSETDRTFYLGAAGDRWDGLLEKLKAAKAPVHEAERVGLVRKSDNALNGYFDLFRSRVIFPILDLRGRVAGFGGRGWDASVTPKYLNSPDSPIFQKSKLLHGLFQARKHIRERNEVILVEGYFDVLVLHQKGFPNAVATCGTSLSADHLKMLRRLTDRIVVLFDADDAGREATERAMELGLDQGEVLYSLCLPDGQDPDEYLLSSPDNVAALNQSLKAAQPILDQRIADCVEKGRANPEALTQAIHRIAKWLSKLQDPVGRELRVSRISERLGIERRLLVQAIRQEGPVENREPRRRQNQISGLPQGNPTRWKPPSAGDFTLLKGLVQCDETADLWEKARIKLPPGRNYSDLFEHSLLRESVSDWLKSTPELQELGKRFAAGIPDGTDPKIGQVLAEVLMAPRSDLDRESLERAMDRALCRLWAKFSEQLRGALRDAERAQDGVMQAELMKEYLDVQRRMKDFNNLYDKS